MTRSNKSCAPQGHATPSTQYVQHAKVSPTAPSGVQGTGVPWGPPLQGGFGWVEKIEFQGTQSID
ncbi:hypothetical protein PCCS19_55610 [Paenibacillus sp. CCS19]|nr:hypothetical protein PCCS19_55610 [Paenibacillus cellulosilyticus]